MAFAVALQLRPARFARIIAGMIRDRTVAKNCQSAWTGLRKGGFRWAFF
jgi:hypothetical protein